MTTTRKRILEMLASGRITAEEADRLLGAQRRSAHGLWSWLFRPLERLDTRAALLIAGGIALLQLLVSRLHVRFDGALDSHLVEVSVPWSDALLDLALAWPLTALILWGTTWLAGRRGRYVDFLGAVGLARAPLIAGGAITGAFSHVFEGAASGTLTPTLLIVSLAILPLIAWFIALLVTGIRTASGLRGMRLGVTATCGILAAELITKLLLVIL